MTEAKVGLLSKLAAVVSQTNSTAINDKLKSYYLMRCKEITRGYGLPDKYFASKIRCPTCCIEWKINTETKVKPVTLSKRQRHRIKSRRVRESPRQYVTKRKELLTSNELQQICTFCKHSMRTPIQKPLRPKEFQPSTKYIEKEIKNLKEPTLPTVANVQKRAMKKPEVKKKEINVYASAMDVFSLQNKNNNIGIKEKPKVINNNKKKKDKFAGLCQQAVLASAKLKEQKDKQNKLSLFLKPSQ